jgi:tetratricopeptide (TPR) repeat protein
VPSDCKEQLKEVGNRAGKGAACGNLGIAYQSYGDFSKAIKHHTQRLAIAKEVGDRAGEGREYGNLGNGYHSQGNFSKAIKYHGQHLATAKEVGDRAGEGRAYRNLGTCHMHLNEYVKTVAYFDAQHALATSLKHSRSSASACLNDRVREAAKWLQAAFDGGRASAKLHLAHLTDAGQEDAALAHLKEHNTSHGMCNGDVTLATRIGREPVEGAAQGYLWSAQHVARCCQRRCVA